MGHYGGRPVRRCVASHCLPAELHVQTSHLPAPASLTRACCLHKGALVTCMPSQHPDLPIMTT